MRNNQDENLMDLKVTNDLIFQRVFGKVGNEEITKGFLEAILGIKIKDLSLDRNKRMQLDKLDNKIGRLDIKAELDDGTIIHIEVQTTEYKFMEKRLLYYHDELYLERLARSQDYEKLSKVVTILIYEYTLNATKGIPNYHTIWNLREKNYPNNVLTYDTEFHVIELPKFNNTTENTEEANWIKFIKVKEMKEMDQIEEINESIKKAKEELKYLASNPKLQQEYKERAKQLRDQISFYSYYRKQGIEQGIKQGISEGVIKGKKEKQIEIAKKLLSKNMPINEIADITGLSEEQIKNCIAEQNS